ncbi:ComF family protein [Methyloligella sp. 2.7D]|uniref:ComF family protein n=1 Tax=unclassified Methyloligella TaxID=2625955 RepID=UPI00157DDF61|nr:ComF family protein [Methyloligella sp. GL2]QKP76598.1 ComF family protein [Methyloligella sp. GL2]
MTVSEADSGGEIAEQALPQAAAASPLRFGAAWLRRVTDFLLPPVCIGCRRPVDAHGRLCGTCWAKIDFIGPPICDRLGIPLPFDTGETMLSAAAIADPPAYDRARIAARYSGTMRELVHSFKYRDRHEGLSQFAAWMVQAGADILNDADLLVPVPLHRSKLRSRRYNQAALLAGNIGKITGIPVDYGLLRRVKRTKAQVRLTADQRRRNVSGAFRVDEKRLPSAAGKHVVIVDDVITTGATVEACARLLRKAAKGQVDVLALARAVDPAGFVT